MNEFNTALLVLGSIIGLFAIALPLVCKDNGAPRQLEPDNCDLPQKVFDHLVEH